MQRWAVVPQVWFRRSTAPLDPAQVARYAEIFGFRFPRAIDENWQTLRRWWLDGGEREWTSVSFLLDRQGVVRWVHPGGEYAPDSDAYTELEAMVETLLDDGE